MALQLPYDISEPIEHDAVILPFPAPAPSEAWPRLDLATAHRRRRMVVFALLAMLAMGLTMLVTALRSPESTTIAYAQSEPLAAAAATADVVVVQPGDTLWVIAQRLRPEGDFLAVVDTLSARYGADLQVGDRLDVSGLRD